MFFKLFPFCIPVKGAKNALICDFQRKIMQPIPLALYEILNDNRDKDIDSLLKLFSLEEQKIVNDYFTFLIDKEFGHNVEDPCQFPAVNLSWYSPNKITHSIVDYCNNSDYDLIQAVRLLSNIGCKHLQIRLFSELPEPFILNILEEVEGSAMSFLSIEIIAPYSQFYTEAFCKKVFSMSPRLLLLQLYNSDVNRIMHLDENTSVIYSQKNIESHHHCGIISKDYFILNQEMYLEGRKKNTCLNGKLSIDIEGNIKNCPSMKKSYGKIDETHLFEVLEISDFFALWGITKDKIDICKDCEYRFVCTDCRAYLTDPEDKHSQPLKCGYNPYTGEWSRWSENPLKKQTAAFYDIST